MKCMKRCICPAKKTIFTILGCISIMVIVIFTVNAPWQFKYPAVAIPLFLFFVVINDRRKGFFSFLILVAAYCLISFSLVNRITNVVLFALLLVFCTTYVQGILSCFLFYVTGNSIFVAASLSLLDEHPVHLVMYAFILVAVIVIAFSQKLEHNLEEIYIAYSVLICFWVIFIGLHSQYFPNCYIGISLGIGAATLVYSFNYVLKSI